MKRPTYLIKCSTKIFLLLALILFSYVGISQTIVHYPQGSHTADIIDPNISATQITPNSGINEVDCGTYISAENFDELSWPNALSSGDYWEFTLTPNPGYELHLSNLTVLGVASDRELPDPLEKRAYVYKIGDGSWNFLASYNCTSLGPNICVNQSSGTNLDVNINTSLPITFAFLYYGNATTSTAQTRFGEVTITGNSILPVELIDFTGEINKDKIHLHWSTESELNNDGFEIQRSVDAITWSLLDFVEGHGSTSSLNKYSYPDKYPRLGANYYRLKQVDLDGGFEYSKVISLTIGNNHQITMFPNPTNGNLQISGVELGEVKIMDHNGRKINEFLLTKPNIDLSYLPMGLYTISVKTDNGVTTKRIVKK